MIPTLWYLLVLCIGVCAGVLSAYSASAYIGPPNFFGVRIALTLLAFVPGVLSLVWALRKQSVDGYLSFPLRDIARLSVFLLTMLPLALWFTLPQLHAHVVSRAPQWAWLCSEQGCGWQQPLRSAISTSPHEVAPLTVETYVPKKKPSAPKEKKKNQ